MSYALIALSLCIGLFVGAGAASAVMRARAARDAERMALQKQSEWAVLQERSSASERALAEARQALDAAAEDALSSREKAAALQAQIEVERRLQSEKLALLQDAQAKLSDAFQALSAEALRKNNSSFLDLAKQTLDSFQKEAKGDLDLRRQAVEALVQPIRQSLEQVAQQVKAVEDERKLAYGGLIEQVGSLARTQDQLRGETGKLVQALRTPNVRGRWGEIQLRKVVELAGMLAHCDFDEQVSATASEGRLKPDLIVHLPGGKSVVVDAKTPLQAYVEATEAQTEEDRRARLSAHAAQVRKHMAGLGAKDYWKQFQPAPEFVVMFLPGEAFFSAALDQDPGLIETGVNLRVIPASPTTLIALLKGVAYGWQQEALAENAAKISELGRQLYTRLCTAAGYVQGIGKSLKKAVEEYNAAIGSLESRVLVSGRKLGALSESPGELAELEAVEVSPKALQAEDWRAEADPAAGVPSGAPRSSEET